MYRLICGFEPTFSAFVDNEFRDIFAIAVTRLWMAVVLAAIMQ
jgi:hypothetical protein